MTPGYHEAFDRLLASVSTARGTLAVLWPVKGMRYEAGGLMLVGRAADGAISASCRPEDLRGPEGREALLRRARQASETMTGPDPTWTHSAFWQVGRHALASRGVCSLDEAREVWSTRLVWSNLFKVSGPAGNPGVRLRRRQVVEAGALLRLEADAFRPGLVLITSGREGWFDLVADGRINVTAYAGAFVRAHAVVDGRPWVVALHPQGKPGTNASKAREVADAARLALQEPEGNEG